MINGLQVISRQQILDKDLRIYGTIEEPLFLAKEVAEWIEHSDVSMMLKKIDEEEKLIQTMLVSGQNREMWFLTEDGLYEVLMQSRMPIAKQFKKKVKNILKQIRQTGGYIPVEKEDSEQEILAKAFLISQKTIEKKDTIIADQHKQLEEQRPKVVYAEAVTVSEDTVLVKDLAIILKQNGLDIGSTRLFDWLRDNGYLCKKKGDMWNMPTQKSLDLGIIVIKHGVRSGSDGEMRKTRTPKITGKGQIYFVNKLISLKSGESA